MTESPKEIKTYDPIRDGIAKPVEWSQFIIMPSKEEIDLQNQDAGQRLAQAQEKYQLAIDAKQAEQERRQERAKLFKDQLQHQNQDLL